MSMFKPPYIGGIFYVASAFPALCAVIGALLEIDAVAYGSLLIVIPMYMIWQNEKFFQNHR